MLVSEKKRKPISIHKEPHAVDEEDEEELSSVIAQNTVAFKCSSAVYFSAVTNILTQMLLEQLFHPAHYCVFLKDDLIIATYLQYNCKNSALCVSHTSESF